MSGGRNLPFLSTRWRLLTSRYTPTIATGNLPKLKTVVNAEFLGYEYQNSRDVDSHMLDHYQHFGCIQTILPKNFIQALF